jgi:diguanylate cyclase (GGDEF)-like protein
VEEKMDLVTLVRASALAGPIADIWIRPDATGAAQRAHIEAAKLFRGAPGFSLEEVVKNIAVALPEIASLFEIDLGSAERIKDILAEAHEALVVASVHGVAPARVAPPPTPAPARKNAERDPVTDLPGGAAGFVYLEQQFAKSITEDEPLSVIVADVDGWPELAARLGEIGAKGLLRALAPCLSNRLRKYDMVVRNSDSEFMFIPPETNSEGAEVVAERARQLVCAKPQGVVGAPPTPVTMSFGCATFTQGSCGSAAELCGLADHALYAAKAAGGNRTALAERTVGAVVRTNAS